MALEISDLDDKRKHRQSSGQG